MNDIDTERLAELLRVLRAAGVTSFRDGDLHVELAVSAPAPLVLQELPADEQDRDPELPEGVFDPRKRIAEIHRKHGGREAT